MCSTPQLLIEDLLGAGQWGTEIQENGPALKKLLVYPHRQTLVPEKLSDSYLHPLVKVEIN